MNFKNDHKGRNRLHSEKSPYLLQHADNPVEWFPWGEEAFSKAKRENKPIFLSIGYSTCHWCHVMAHESFEDEDIAGLMNEVFVSIKVDREERPDIDSIYMTVCQMMTGRGGWPLTIIMGPDKRPFFAGTYIPKESRYGMSGMKDFIVQINRVWRDRQGDVKRIGEEVEKSMQKIASTNPKDRIPEKSLMGRAFNDLMRIYDERYGGFGKAPKFPNPTHLLFLMCYWKSTGDSKAIDMVKKTLQQMRLGGIYDHIGFGFHRYSTDQKWFLPHFEKMLYDQALLAIVYTEAYQATKNQPFMNTADEIITYVLRNMTSPEGGFYSAEDADSEGEEGRFYVWSDEEISHVLDEDEVNLCTQVFGFEDEGNYVNEGTKKKDGRNIVHMRFPLEALAHSLAMDIEDLRGRLHLIRNRLFQHRETRVRPHKDDKILTDWNGLMIAALACAYKVQAKPEYLMAAQRACEFLQKKMSGPGGETLHRYREGESAFYGQLNDYAFLLWGMLELYEASFDVTLLKTASDLNRYVIKHFWDEREGGFYLTADNSEVVLVRHKEVYDGALPSGNSVQLYNLLRLSRFTGDMTLFEIAKSLIRSFADNIDSTPMGYTFFLKALDFYFGPTYEIVVAGERGERDTERMIRELRSLYLPNKVMLFKSDNEARPFLAEIAGFTAELHKMKGVATCYVCRDFTCMKPSTDIETVVRQLDENAENLPGQQ